MSAPHQRTARPGRDVRILRAAVFAAVCVVLAAGGHALGSCASIPLWTLGAGFLAVLAVAVPLAGRERSMPGIAALLALGQTVLHTLFGLGQHGADAGSAATASDASLVAQAARLVCGTTAAAISPAQAHKILTEARLSPAPLQAHHPAETVTDSASLLPSLPMLLGHLLAALAAGWLLRRGDLALRRLIGLSAHSLAEGAAVRSLRAALALVRTLRAGLPDLPGTGPRRPRTALLAVPEPRTAALQHTVIRRGPPPAVPALVLAA
ncbi:integral membrane protein [Streptomyces davaonensis JCM 4913]|uniref:Integral membrane protein n=1 Tax=Streptomyces davaonensis (strain DSM 101723 / JCM 4913 / KCC S-0913 / 768) TaxID=1214101 RepID=K4R6K0_STRDJ|nr:hypothetical protein [Streptomyces davaonensis]CCK28983.1 integral membrane protein [Streptomyces davaonensis JCM 4913]